MKPRIRALVVDDEPLARERLRTLLLGEPDVEVLAECGDGKQAVEAIRTHAPDLVFLDIQMPELDGFGVLQQLDPQSLPDVIFVTAYDRFALDAFEVHALDYLLKPFDVDRFQKALQRARQRWQSRQSGELDRRIADLLAEVKGARKHPDRIAVKTDGRILLVRPDEIDWIEAADNYVSLHVGGETYLHRETMASIEAKLPTDKFMRISRSAIVNLERIKELQPLFHGEYTVVLKNGARLTLSRSYREKLQSLLGRE